MATLFQLPKAVPISAGNGYAGAKCHFYQAGTTTNITTYTTAALSVAHANPVVADANGVFAPIFINETVNTTYKMRLVAASGTMIYEIDNLPAAHGTAITDAEIAAGVTVVNEGYDPGHIPRYGTNTTPGTTDMTSAFNAAIAQALSGGFGVFIPAGIYLVSSALTAITAGIRISGEGYQSIIRPTVSGGGNVITINQGVNFVSLEDFVIDSNINAANFLSGSINGQNCIGIRGLSGGGNYTTRWHIKNVQVRGLLRGVDIDGFIGSAENLFIHYCEEGFRGTTCNAVRLNLRIENCRKDFALTGSNGIHLDQLVAEGGCANALASTIDNCNGVKFTAPYWEHGTNTRTVPFLTVGGTTIVTGLEIDGGILANGTAHTHDVALLKLDNVDGALIKLWYGSGAYRSNIETTANTKNYRFLPYAQTKSWSHDNSKSQSRALNVWPNPRFDAWFRGWTDVTHAGVTPTQETTIVRRGPNALRLTCTASAGSHRSEFYIAGDVVTRLRGKRVMVGAWVWVPNTAPFLQPSPTALPWVQVQSYNGSVFTSPATTDNNAFLRNAWNFMWSQVTMQSDATRLYISLFVNNSGNTLTINEYAVFDEVIVVEGGDAHLHSVMNGDVQECDINPCRVTNGLVELFGTAAPTDVDQIYAVGDKVWKTDVAAAGSPGWVCTTAGVGGTAVFKAMANVAA